MKTGAPQVPDDALSTETSARLGSFFELVPTGNLVMTGDGQIVLMNKRLKGWLGYVAGIDDPVHVREFLSKDSKILLETQIKPLLFIGLPAEEIALDLVGPNGISISVLVNADHLRFDGISPELYVLTIIRAESRRSYEREILAERRRASDAHLQLKSVLESSSDSVVLTDAAYSVIFANKKSKVLFGQDILASTNFINILTGECRFGTDVLQKGMQEAYNSAFEFPYKNGLFTLEVSIREAGNVHAFFIRDITARKMREREVEKINSQIASIVTHFPGGIAFWDSSLRMQVCNQKYIEVMDLPASMFEGGYPKLEDIFRYNIQRGEISAEGPNNSLEEMMERAREPHQSNFERVRPNGTILNIHAMPVPDGGFVTLVLDVTERKAQEFLIFEKSKLAEEKSRALEITFAHMNQGVSVFDKDGNLTMWNDNYAHLYEMTTDTLYHGVFLLDLLHIQKGKNNFDGSPEDFLQEIFASVRENREFRSKKYFASGRVVSAVHTPMPDGGWVSTHDDVTELERNSERIVYAAQHDFLTGLLNRSGFKTAVERALHKKAAKTEKYALMLLDLDRFKAVNDSYGHGIGDQLLIAVADRIRKTVRNGESVSRLGGDEFAIYLDAHRNQRINATTLAKKLISALSKSYWIDGRRIEIGVSVGIALTVPEFETVDSLMSRADTALYFVKGSGRNGFQLFDEAIAQLSEQKRDLEQSLRDCDYPQEFVLHYQPIVDVKTRKTIGYEALVRWHHPKRGMLSPDVFIPLAEQTGLIEPLGKWIVERACADAAQWPEGTRLAVNVSVVQLGVPGFVEGVINALFTSGLRPAQLELEVTESVLLGKSEPKLADLQRLKDLGVRIVLDDFGTGFSSLSYLRIFPFDKIKIDRTFVRDMAENRQSAEIVYAVTRLALGLNIETTAEGVETEEQFAMLAAVRCSTVQGYLFGRPRPIELLERPGHNADAFIEMAS